MLETERQFFDNNREDLLRRFPGKFIVVKEQQVLGPFDLIEDALGAGAKEFGMTSFLVRRTDQLPEDASIPALTLGLLRADSSHPIDGPGTDS
jgi:hypothetical protein